MEFRDGMSTRLAPWKTLVRGVWIFGGFYFNHDMWLLGVAGSQPPDLPLCTRSALVACSRLLYVSGVLEIIFIVLRRSTRTTRSD